MNKLSKIAVVFLLMGCVGGCGGGDDEEKVGTQCCALQAFCSACSTCDSDEIDIGDSEDETACQQINDGFIDRGRYCHPNNAPPSRSIEEDIADCASR